MLFRSGLLISFFLFISNINAQNFELIDSCEILTDTGFSQGCSWADYNNDNLIDLFVTNNWTPVNNLFYKNNGDGSFTKITNEIISNEGGRSNGCSWADYNNDGFIDLCVANVNNQNNYLYKNDNGFHFTKITNDIVASDSGWSYGCTWGDYDNDGFVDLYISNYKNQLNYLYHNEHGDHFTKVLNSVATQDSSWTQSSIWSDFNNDGYPDLFVANYGVNFLFKNNGDGSFTKITNGAIVTDNDNSFGASAADFNNDGLIDIFVANWNGKNCLYKNLSGFQFEKMIIPGMTTETNNSEGSAWGDYDNDGDKDLFVSNDGLDFLYENLGQEQFNRIENISMCTLGSNSNGVAWGDYNGDGFLDMFVANGGNHPNQLYHNTGNSNHSITVKCVGRKSNASAIGTKIFVRAIIFGIDVVQLYEITSQSGGGYGSQNSMQTVIGLGDASNVKEVRVMWPSGLISELQNINANEFYTIDENGAEPAQKDFQPIITNNPSTPGIKIHGNTYRNNQLIVLRLYTILGQEARIITLNSDLSCAYEFRINSENENLDKGIYLFSLDFEDRHFFGKFILN